jgi:hypothetical protein
VKIKLTTWAERLYDPVPSRRTLRGWVKSGQIYPEPELVGREYMVDERAVRIPLPAADTAANDCNKMSARALSILRAAA